MLRKSVVALLRKIQPKRLYKYGMVGLKVFDDRTWKEKFADKLEEYFEVDAIRVRDTNVWHTYFDYSLGRYVDSPEILRQKEKSGKVRMSFEEMERTAKKYKEQSKLDYRDNIKKAISKSLYEVRQGRSFYREQLERIPGDMKLKRERMQESQRLMNGK